MKTHEYEKNIKCPYCDHEWQDSWEWEPEHETHTCGDCGKEFNVERHVEVTYSTSEFDCKQKKEDHDYKFAEVWIKKQNYVSYGMWDDIPEQDWRYFEITKCSKCEHEIMKEITKEQSGLLTQPKL